MTTKLSPQEREALLDQFEQMAYDMPFNLLTPRRLRELAAIESEEVPIISVYLDLSPQFRIKRAWLTAYKTMAHEAVEKITDRKRARKVEAELERIQRALIQMVPDLGRGVALFVSEPLGLWRQMALPVPLPNRIEVGKRPFLRPLFRTQDEHDRYVVVLLDKRRARLFVSQIGYTEEVADLYEETPNRHDQGGWSQMHIQRHHDAHVLWHASAVAYATMLVIDQFQARYLLVSGTPEVLVEYREHLPAPAAQRYAGEFELPIIATTAEITAAIEPLQREIEAREEVATLQRLQEAAPIGRGTWGLESTFQALNEQRVMTLVVREDFQAMGAVCTNCGILTAEIEDVCPACGGRLEIFPDAVDIALERAVDQDAALEIVCSQPGKAMLEQARPIGAIFRF